ncbi:hydrophobic/amphiphilic exporter-1, HAE1 family [Chitinophaga sp. YR573]|uniref:efflux RND transporter permease subunit n=1 Tax=Chitinophaga sp. YR573 TaxID=1881040 RepID=UPI0008D24418|nr:efflux RND transporter permease subunit [Chitinophaga sp. YR573]SEW40552.1 hydrophobic/amphiphilic exporter-1, HAE1 family [Chitinophaga sp. YR573]
MSITKIAINRPSLIIVIFTILIGGGMFCYTKLNYELMPDITQPTLVISTSYPGATPTNVEQTVTKKIEDVVSGVDRLKSMTSQSMEGNSVIQAEFTMGTDIDDKQQELQRKINNILSDLPDDVKTPGISKVSPSDQPIMQLTATSSMDNAKFYDIVKDEIKPQFQQIAGVGEITLIGGQEREIQINVNREKLEYYGISIAQVIDAINRGNTEFPTGKVKTRQEQMTVRVTGKFTSVPEISELVVAQPARGSVVKLKEVASVSDIVKDASAVSRYNDVNGIGILIKKQNGANAVEISKEVKRRLAQLQQKYSAQNVKFTIADDTADFTMESAESVEHDLIIAIVLVAAIMLLFLHSLRDSLIVLVAIPASLLSTFSVMYLLGYSLNLMTLLALSLVIGILVDDSIVVLENIHRHLHMGKPKRQAALDGRMEIGFSALAITMVDVVVFGPIALVNTTIAPMLRQYSLTIVTATLFSLLVCYTLTPWLASRFGKITVLNQKNWIHKILIGFETLIERLTDWYANALKWVLKHKLILTAIVISLFIGIGLVMNMGILGSELVAAGDQGKIQLKLEYDKNTTVIQNNLYTKRIEDYLLSQPDVVSVFSNVAGPSTTGLQSSAAVGSEYKSELTVKLVDKKLRSLSTEQYMIRKSHELEVKFPGVKVRSSVVGMVSMGDPIQIVLSSENYDLLMKTANDLKRRIDSMPGTNDISLSVEDGNPQVEVNIDRDKMSQLGLDINTVGATLKNAYAGNTDAKFRVGNKEYDINIKFDDFDRQNVSDVENLTFMNSSNQQVKLSQFATIVQGSGPSVLERKNRRTAVTVKSNVLGITSGIVSDMIKESLIKNPIPAAVDLKWSGDAEKQDESMGALMIAMLAALVLMYLVMVALYDSFVYPFVVLFSIPVSFIGAFLALNLAKSSMSMFTMLGIIMLFGLVAKNAILIVDFANHRKEEGESTFDALIDAGKTRLRPILMTTVAMVAGMFPIAIAKGAGSEWKNGLGWVLIGGLSSSLILTIFVVPMVYYVVDMVKLWWKNKFGRTHDETNLQVAHH